MGIVNPSQLQVYDDIPKDLLIAVEDVLLDRNDDATEKLIAIAGGENAISEFEDFKPLTPEAVVKGNPDYILMFDKGLESIGGVDGVLKLEGVATTNAGKNKKIIAMDGGLLSGFGPRVGQAAVQLNQLLQK